ncbi:hypothetical protein ACTHQ6_15260 [Arthrobacter sp. SAFR-179]|uniref:hypothetical protein n=1 Tax=Arthrobacter sp. SAFR-179 TaxID=3387279 RepID=UPI003F7C8D7B
MPDLPMPYWAMAIGMTRRGTWLRYGLLSALLVAIHLGTQWYFSEGVYEGRANVPLRKFPENVSVLDLLTFTPIFIGLKFLAYDSAVRSFTKGYRPPALMVIFIAGYVVALAMDIACLTAAAKPIADSGFALLGPILQTPFVLFLAGAIIAGLALQKDFPPEAQPNNPR